MVRLKFDQRPKSSGAANYCWCYVDLIEVVNVTKDGVNDFLPVLKVFYVNQGGTI